MNVTRKQFFYGICLLFTAPELHSTFGLVFACFLALMFGFNSVDD